MQTVTPIEIIENKIYVVRGQKIMLDSDLAWLYEVETRVLNQAVKRNIERFPEDFMFQLTKEEWENLKFQFGSSKLGEKSTWTSQIVISKKGDRKIPYAFTEHGVAMLSSVLRSKRAVAINIQIIRIFNKLRNLAVEHKDLREELNELTNSFIRYARENNLELEEIYRQLDNLKDVTRPTKIGFNI